MFKTYFSRSDTAATPASSVPCALARGRGEGGTFDLEQVHLDPNAFIFSLVLTCLLSSVVR